MKLSNILDSFGLRKKIIAFVKNQHVMGWKNECGSSVGDLARQCLRTSNVAGM